MARIGYARVSTEDQNLDLQWIALDKAQCSPIITDQGISGARAERPGLKKVLALAQRGDTIVVWRLDRLGRSLSHLVGLIAEFRAREIHFASLNEAIDTSTPTGMFVFHMIAALAEFERALISERTRAGMAAARMRGVKLGRPRKDTFFYLTDDSDENDFESTDLEFRQNTDCNPPPQIATIEQPESVRAVDEACEDEPGRDRRPQ